MIADLHQPEDRERDPDVAGQRRPTPATPRRAACSARARRSTSECRTSRTRRARAASPGTFAPFTPKLARHSTGNDTPYFVPACALRIIGSSTIDVAEQDREHRLPPRHALLHQAGGERVGGDDHAHADPERGDVIRGPGAARRAASARGRDSRAGWPRGPRGARRSRRVRPSAPRSATRACRPWGWAPRSLRSS